MRRSVFQAQSASHPTNDPNSRDYCHKSRPSPHQNAILLARNSKSSRVTRSKLLTPPLSYVDWLWEITALQREEFRARADERRIERRLRHNFSSAIWDALDNAHRSL